MYASSGTDVLRTVDTTLAHICLLTTTAKFLVRRIHSFGHGVSRAALAWVWPSPTICEYAADPPVVTHMFASWRRWQYVHGLPLVSRTPLLGGRRCFRAAYSRQATAVRLRRVPGAFG